jgi:beta-lactamase regulating signal transducer with metallopeptidase domain
METLLRAALNNAVAATLMALLVTCLSRPLARRPAIVHGLWLLVLLKLVTPPIYEVPIPWPVSSATSARISPEPALIEVDSVASVVVPGDAMEAPDDLAAVPVALDAECEMTLESPSPTPIGATSIDLSRWIGATWLAGSATVLLLSIRRIRRFQRLLSEARAPSWLEQEWVDEWGRRLGLRRAPDLRWVPGRISPMIWFVGLWPRLILPEVLWKRLDAQQRSTLLAHELAHLRRGDHYVRLLELLVTALFWWHPLVWWIRSALRDVEEECCDAWVVWALPEAVRSYAETLLDTLEFLQSSGRSEPLLASGLGKVLHLRRRLTMIMTGTSFRVLGVRGTLGLLALAVTLLPVGASWAQKAEEPTPLRGTLTFADGQATLDLPAELTKDGPLIFTDVTAMLPSSEPHIGHMKVQVQDQAGTRVLAAGSIDDVVKTLQVKIAELKQRKALTGSLKQEIGILERALEEVKKIPGSLKEVSSTGATKGLSVVGNMRYIEERGTPTKDEEKASELMKLRRRVLELRKTLEASAKELHAVQGRIRELGGDPGEVPSIEWRRTANKSLLPTLTYTFAKPVEDSQLQVRTYTIARPVEVKQGAIESKAAPTAKPLAVRLKAPELEGKLVAPPADQKARFKKLGAEALELEGKLVAPPADQKARFKKLMAEALKAQSDGRYDECEALAAKAQTLDPSDPVPAILQFKAQIQRKLQLKDQIRKNEQKLAIGKAASESRIEALEKRLKALQDEVERLKKGSTQGDVKR